MVQSEGFFMIRDLKSKGLSNVQIANQLGIDRKTVAKWATTVQLPKYQRKMAIPSKLEAFKTYILTLMSEGCVNANTLFDEIVARATQASLQFYERL